MLRWEKIAAFGNATRRFRIVLFAIAISLGAVSAQELRITFPSNSATLSRNYQSNLRSFSILDSLLDRQGSVFVDSVLVVPEFHLRRPLFAVSTNLLYDFGGAIYPMAWTPNLSVEVPIGSRWSVYAEYDFPWWLSRHKASDPMDVLHGHFLGIGLGAGYYDIEPQHSGYPVMSADSNHPGRAGTWEI